VTATKKVNVKAVREIMDAFGIKPLRFSRGLQTQGGYLWVNNEEGFEIMPRDGGWDVCFWGDPIAWFRTLQFAKIFSAFHSYGPCDAEKLGGKNIAIVEEE
jgi:hypothetical protein